MQNIPPIQNQTQSTPASQPENPSPTVQAPIQSTPEKRIPWLLISIIVLLLSAIGVLGYKYYQVKQQLDNQQLTSLPSPQLVVNSPSPVSSPTTEIDPTVNWKTYKNFLIKAFIFLAALVYELVFK